MDAGTPTQSPGKLDTLKLEGDIRVRPGQQAPVGRSGDEHLWVEIDE